MRRPVVHAVSDVHMASKVRTLEKDRFVQRGDVTGEYGRSTYGRTFEKLIWKCIKRRSHAERVGIIEKRETICDWIKATCMDFKTKKYWKEKFQELLEISRAEHSILGIVWPMDDELVYFNRTQRLVCYYCGMAAIQIYDNILILLLVSLLLFTYSLTHSLTHEDTHSDTHPPTHPLTHSLTHYRNTARICGDGCVLPNHSNECDWRGCLCGGYFDIPHVASRSADPVDVCGSFFCFEFFWSFFAVSFLKFVLGLFQRRDSANHFNYSRLLGVCFFVLVRVDIFYVYDLFLWFYLGCTLCFCVTITTVLEKTRERREGECVSE